MGQLNALISHSVKCIDKITFCLVSTPNRGRGKLSMYRIQNKTFQNTSCQHKFFCSSLRNFSAVRAFWYVSPKTKLYYTSSPKLPPASLRPPIYASCLAGIMDPHYHVVWERGLTFCPGWPQTPILPRASQVGGITGVSYLAQSLLFIKYTSQPLAHLLIYQ
jgi:hypothetical protein